LETFGKGARLISTAPNDNYSNFLLKRTKKSARIDNTIIDKTRYPNHKFTKKCLPRLIHLGGSELEFEQLSLKLREFYLLETYQVSLFGDQIHSLPDEYTAYAFERMKKLEQDHVDFFSEKMHALGISLPEIANHTFSFAGFVSAKALDLLSLKERYKLGIAVESKAAEMYYDFIKMAEGDPQLVRMLWHQRTDEEFHKFWFRANLEKIELEEKLENV
jgi:bacterioferritin